MSDYRIRRSLGSVFRVAELTGKKWVNLLTIKPTAGASEERVLIALNRLVREGFHSSGTHWERWCNKYRPLSRDSDNGSGLTYQFDFPEDQAFLKAVDAHHVWTVTDGDSGKMYIGQGFHVVNRQFYLVTSVPWKDSDPQMCILY